MASRPLIAAALLATSPLTAVADTPAVAFFDLLEKVCLPAIESGETPDLSALTPHDRDNPDHNVLGSIFGAAYVEADPRLLIAFGELNGLRGCEVSFAGQTVGAEGKAIADALETWIYDHIDQTGYELIDHYSMYSIKYVISVGSLERNPRDYFVKIAAFAGVNPDDDTHYGHPRVVVGEMPDDSRAE